MSHGDWSSDIADYDMSRPCWDRGEKSRLLTKTCTVGEKVISNKKTHQNKIVNDPFQVVPRININ